MSRAGSLKRDASGAWYFVVDLSPPGAPRRQVKRRGFRTKSEAQEALDDLKSGVRRGEWVEPSRETLGAFLDEWLAAIEPTVRPATHVSYARNVRLHVTPRVGALPLQSIDGGTLNRLYAELSAAGRRPRGGGVPLAWTPEMLERAAELRDGGSPWRGVAEHLVDEFGASWVTRHNVSTAVARAERPSPASPSAGLAPKTVHYVHTILHRAFRDAVRWGRLGRNPADAADPPKPGSRNRGAVKAWTAEQLGDFLQRSSEDRYGPLWHLLASTGMRRGEALGLRWRDVDLEGGVAAVHQTLIVVDHQVQLGQPKTTSGVRSIDLDGDTVAVLREHRRAQLEERMLMGAGWRDHDLVFARPTGEPYHPDRISREFSRRVARWGLPTISVHGLRHTWATLALRAGVHPRVVQERLGHSTIAITLEIYSHVTPGMGRDAAEQVASLFRRPALP